MDSYRIDNLVAAGHCVYVVYQRERGVGGTEHFQGYVQWKKQVRMTSIKAILGQRVHLEKAKGTPKQASDYCKKEEGRVDGPHEFGEISEAGRRNDLEEFIAAASSRELTHDDLLGQFAAVTAR